jgi:hypothetical protein
MNNGFESSKFRPTTLLAKHRKTIVNLILIVLAFFLIVKPLLKSVKGITQEPAFEGAELPHGTKGYVGIPESAEMNKRAKILEISNSNPEKTREVIKGWIGEEG